MRGLVPTLLVMGFMAGCAQVEPAPAPKPKRVKIDPLRVWALPGEGRSFLRYDLEKWPIRRIDPSRAERLARVLFPGVEVETIGLTRRLTFDSERSAASFLDAARWTDGMILALETMEDSRGSPPTDNAGIILENVRRYLILRQPVELPDWAAVSRALDDEAVWTASPNIAGVGAVLLSAVILKDGAGDLARDRADSLLGKAVTLRHVPGWLSWIAQLNWVRRDFSASEESP
jgi:hypothetical protein